MKRFIVRTGLYLFIFSISFCACNNNGSGKGEVHPKLSLIIKNKNELIDISKKKIGIWENHFKIDTTKLLSINVLDNKYGISRLSGVLLFKNQILILDDGINKVHSIGFDGTANTPITIAGRGPGELTEPLNMMKLKNGFMIADRVNGIHYFNNKSKYVTTRQIKYLPDRACQIGKDLFIKTSYLVLNGESKPDGHTIFEIDEGNNVLGKYSHRYKHKDNMLVFNMTDGPLLCSESRGLVINTYNFTIPILELYFVRQGKSRIYHFTDLNPYKIEYVDDSLRPSKKNYGTTYNIFKAVNILNNRFIIVQYSEVNRPSDPEKDYDSKILSYIIDLDTNNYYYSYSLTQIKATSGNIIFSKDSKDSDKYILSRFEIEKN